jgi:Arc/MetJ-type ribon-helix-helix transcriptional regulator
VDFLEIEYFTAQPLFSPEGDRAMPVEISVFMSDEQDGYVRKLVEEGRYASPSAVVQRGLDLVRDETELEDTDLAALKKLLDWTASSSRWKRATGRLKR